MNRNYRNHLTEQERINLVAEADDFWGQLGKMAAEKAAKFSPEVEHLIIAHLQDCCSIYSTRYSEYLHKLRHPS